MTLTIEIASPLAESIIAMAERAGVSAEEHAIRLLEVATERLLEEKSKARPSKPPIQPIRGRFANTGMSSEDFAREKREEIEREERHFS